MVPVKLEQSGTAQLDRTADCSIIVHRSASQFQFGVQTPDREVVAGLTRRFARSSGRYSLSRNLIRLCICSL
jgi:hypothetical protein